MDDKADPELAPTDFFLRVLIKALWFTFRKAKITYYTISSFGVKAQGCR